MKDTIPNGPGSSRRRKAEELAGLAVRRIEDLHRGGWDPEARMGDQDRDGVAAEVIYHPAARSHDPLQPDPDPDYKKACFDAYNLWIAEYCSPASDRLIGLGNRMRSPRMASKDLESHQVDGVARRNDAGFGPGRFVQPDLDELLASGDRKHMNGSASTS